MSIVPRSRFLILATLAAVLSGCGRGGPGPAVDAGWLAGLEQVRSAIASATGFSPTSIEVMASRAHLRISSVTPGSRRPIRRHAKMQRLS